MILHYQEDHLKLTTIKLLLNQKINISKISKTFYENHLQYFGYVGHLDVFVFFYVKVQQKYIVDYFSGWIAKKFLSNIWCSVGMLEQCRMQKRTEKLKLSTSKKVMS